MATSWPLKIEIDCPEPRVTIPRYVAAAQGDSWMPQYSTDTVFFDAVTGTAMLMPLPFHADWLTNHTGNYARFRKTDYNTGLLTDATKWIETTLKNAGDYYLTSQNQNDVVISNVLLPANQPMYVSFWMSGTKDSAKSVVFQCGYNYNQADEIRLKVYGDGSIEVYKSGDLKEKYDSTKGDIRPGGMKLYSISPKNSYVSLLILPCRRRELLIQTNYGTNFCHAFDDLDTDVPYDQNTNAITPSGYFWWHVPAPLAVIVQACRCRFKESGTISGAVCTLRTVPQVGTDWTGWTAGADRIGPNGSTIGSVVDVVNADGTAWNPAIPTNSVRAIADLTGDGLATWGVYTINMFTETTTDTTSDEPIDITNIVESCTIEVDENGVSEITLSAKYHNLFNIGSVDHALYQSDRPIRVAIQKGDLSWLDIFRGTLDSPDIVHAEGDLNEGLVEVTYKGKDRQLDFELTMLLDSVPYDGIPLADAIEDLLGVAGFTASDYYINTDAFVLPYSTAISTGKFSFAPERGDTVATWLEKFWNEYCQTYKRGWWPSLLGYRYNFVKPETFSDTPQMELFRNVYDARVYGVSETLMRSRTIRKFSRKYEAAEANHLQVLGYDPRTDVIITVNANDAASQDPTTPVASRGRDWRGRIASVYHENASITTFGAADRALEVLTDRLFVGRDLCEWESDFLIKDDDDRPLWIGDVVRIYNGIYTTYEYETSYTDYRIIAIPSIQFKFEVEGAISVRTARYRGQALITPVG